MGRGRRRVQARAVAGRGRGQAGGDAAHVQPVLVWAARVRGQEPGEHGAAHHHLVHLEAV